MAQEDKSPRRAAATRLLSLRRATESDAEFARRLGLQSQHITNYKKTGVSLEIIARLASKGKLSDADVVYVVTGRHPGNPLQTTTGKARAFDELVETLDRLKRDLKAIPERATDDQIADAASSAVAAVDRAAQLPADEERPVPARRSSAPKSNAAGSDQAAPKRSGKRRAAGGK